MEAHLSEITTEVLCDVLEKFAFEFGDPADLADIRPPGEETFIARMCFRGVSQGALTLLVPRGLGLEIAANVLGLDPEDASVPERAHDAIKEVLNVVCGNLLTRIAGEEAVFDLSIPETRLAGAGIWDEWLAREDTIGVLVDDRPLLLQLQNGEPAA